MRFTSKVFYVARLYGVSSSSLGVFEVIRWQVIGFQMIAGPCSIFF